MDSAAGIWVILCAAGCAAQLLSQRLGWRPGVWMAKPVAAGAFVLAGLASGALESTFGRWILLGLVFSWFGDMLLIPEGVGPLFLAGMASFLATHLAFAAGFWSVGPSLSALAAASVFMAGVAWAVLGWLRPHLSGALARAVPLYVVVISAMVALSAGAGASLSAPSLLVGASLFAASDVSVARERFVHAAFLNSAWGLPTYFLAQLVLALSVGAALEAPAV